MMQFNLLPDVKIEYLKAERTKRFVSFIAFCVASATLAIFVILLVSVNILQKQHISNLNTDIQSDSKTLQDRQDLEKVLTVQNQLSSLPGLHDAKPVSSRLFAYLGQVTPAQVTISKLDVDFETSTMQVAGSADALSTVNKFIDTLKFTKFITGETTVASSESPDAFTEVVLTNFSVVEEGKSYRIDFKFDPTIFDSAERVALAVPNIISTRSAVEKPNLLFQPAPNEEIEE